METGMLLETENKLQNEARAILHNKVLWAPFLAQGKILPCGSFDLGLLVYGDLDVYFEPHAPNEATTIFAEAIKNAVLYEAVKTIRFERDLHMREQKAPKGLYLQLKFDNGIRLWQIDIWFVDKASQDAFFKEHEARKTKITPRVRERILQIKHELMANKGKTPSFCSYWVYKAVLEEGLSETADIKAYLAKQGIRLF